MKKVILLLVAVFSLGMAVNAQNAIGVRGAFGSGNGAEISYMHGLGANRLELDLGWYTYSDWGGYVNLTGIYQWKGELGSNFGWYAGVGANIGFWMDKHGNDGNLGLGLDCQAGLEYNFQALPLQVTLDARPQWDFLGHSNGFGYLLALGLRYRF